MKNLGLWPLFHYKLKMTKELPQMNLFRSVPSPLHAVRNTTLFYLNIRNSLAPVQIHFPGHAIQENFLSPLGSAVLRLLCTYNMRIGELLQLNVRNIMPGDRVYVNGLKKSASYIIYVTAVSKFFSDDIAAQKYTPLFPVSYNKIYRWCLKIGINIDVGNKKNRAVTHASRYVAARTLNHKISGQGLSDVLRHRRLTTKQYYLPKEGK